jgi:dTMP kinase
MWSVVTTFIIAVLLLGLLGCWLAWRKARSESERLAERLRQAEERLSASEQRAEAKSQQLDQLGGQLQQAREEQGRLKKRLFDAEKKLELLEGEKNRQAAGEPEKLRELEERCAALRAEASKLREQQQEVQEKLRRQQAECESLRARLKELHQQTVGERASDVEKLKALEQECERLRRKLESARRKARNDEQVYRVTKSKLELALEKIAVLEKSLAGQAAAEKPSTVVDQSS